MVLTNTLHRYHLHPDSLGMRPCQYIFQQSVTLVTVIVRFNTISQIIGYTEQHQNWRARAKITDGQTGTNARPLPKNDTIQLSQRLHRRNPMNRERFCCVLGVLVPEDTVKEADGVGVAVDPSSRVMSSRSGAA